MFWNGVVGCLKKHIIAQYIPNFAHTLKNIHFYMFVVYMSSPTQFAGAHVSCNSPQYSHQHPE